MRVLLVALSLLLAVPAYAQTADDVSAAINANFGDAREFERAFVSIQGAVAEGDAASVASWVAYPITVTDENGDKLTLEDESQFVEHYDEFMTDEIVDAVAQQDYAALFVNSEGVMFGDGQMWISGVCPTEACEGFDVKIITIQSTAE